MKNQSKPNFTSQRRYQLRHGSALMCYSYTRQIKLRVTSRSKQCNSIFNEMPVLIQISDCFNNLTDDILGPDEQFPVKIFFSKILIFEISKILIFNPKSLNFKTLWLINHLSFRRVNRAILNRCLTTLGAYSGSLRFFQYEISPLFFDPFPKSWWSAPKICNCDFDILVYIKPSLMHRMSDH